MFDPTYGLEVYDSLIAARVARQLTPHKVRDMMQRLAALNGPTTWDSIERVRAYQRATHRSECTDYAIMLLAVSATRSATR